MPRIESRRTLLRSAGLAVLGGFAGCLVNTSSEDSPDGDPDGNPDRDGEPTDSGGNSDPGGNSSDGTNDGTTTPEPGRTFSITVENNLNSKDLAQVPDVAPDAPAKVSIEAGRSVSAAPDEVLFSKEVELSPGKSRTFEDVVPTVNGESYNVKAELTPFVEKERSSYQRSRYRTNTHWEEGGFGGPEKEKIKILVDRRRNAERFQPYVWIG